MISIVASFLVLYSMAAVQARPSSMMSAFHFPPSAHRQQQQQQQQRHPSDVLRTPILIGITNPVTNNAITSSQLNRVIVPIKRRRILLYGWVQRNGEWLWEEDNSTAASSSAVSTATRTITDDDSNSLFDARATPTLPSGQFRPKQSLGQNYLRDGNTVAKIVKAFVKDATSTLKQEYDPHGSISGISDAGDDANRNKNINLRAVELGPGAGALTDVLLPVLGTNGLQCIEIDDRSVSLLQNKHPKLRIVHADVLQVNYPALAMSEGGPLSIIGNLPYYITSQILFALADASHSDSVRSATVTMQWEVGRRIVAPTKTKDYGILSVVFQLYADCHIHFKIPPTVFYPQPKVDSCLVGLHFLGPSRLKQRLAGVRPSNLRSVVTTAFRQRRKTVRNGLKPLVLAVYEGDGDKVHQFFDREPMPLPRNVLEARDNGDAFALRQELPKNWASMRPEELSAGQFVEITRMLFSTGQATEFAMVVDEEEIEEEEESDYEKDTKELGSKVWRKMKHGQ